MKVLIAGTRNCNDYDTLYQIYTKVRSKQSEVEIVSGTKVGADKPVDKYADENGYPIKQFSVL